MLENFMLSLNPLLSFDTTCWAANSLLKSIKKALRSCWTKSFKRRSSNNGFPNFWGMILQFNIPLARKISQLMPYLEVFIWHGLSLYMSG